MKIKLHTQIFIAIVFGVIAGYFLKDLTPTFISPFGQVFMRLLKLLVIPLVFTSVTLGIVSIGDTRHLGSISAKTFTYFISTGFIATIIGITLAEIIKPGVGSQATIQKIDEIIKGDPPSFTELLVSIAPQNIFESLASGDILPVIVFAILLGVALTNIGSKGKPVVSFFESAYEAIMQITDWIIRLTPIGVFALSATVVATLGIKSLFSVGTYFITVVLGLFIHAVIILPIILKIFGRYSAIELVRKILPALAIAAPTASTGAALPVAMECINKNVGVPNKVTSFLLPVGTTIDMNGTALYQGVAVMFIAQMYGIPMDLYHKIIIVITAFFASAGAAAVPGAGLVTMVIILNAVGVPVEGLSFILAVDRILDSCRSPVNLWSNAIGSVVVARLEGEKLKPHEAELEYGILEPEKS